MKIKSKLFNKNFKYGGINIFIIIILCLSWAAILCLWAYKQSENPAPSKPELGQSDNSTSSKNSDSDIQSRTIEAPLGKVVENSVGMKLVWIPAGSFQMGSNKYASERPMHKTIISSGFYLGQTMVTQGNWQQVMNTRPWSGKGYAKEGSDYVASYIRWDDAMAFCRALSIAEGRKYRLPTEAEWEYACRAGTQTAYSFGDSESQLKDYAWYSWNGEAAGDTYAHRAGIKHPNLWGLYDMHGNVWEWCSDWYSSEYYSNSPSIDPQGPSTGEMRVRRGGSWRKYPDQCRSASRSGASPGYYGGDVGFRIALEY